MNLLSSLRPGAYGHLQLGAGVLLEGFDPAAYPDSTALRAALAGEIAEGSRLLGVTRGGGSFRAVPEMHRAAVDGARSPIVGDAGLQWLEATLSGTLLEVTAENLRRLMPWCVRERSGGRETIRASLAAAPACIPLLTWVGDLGDGGVVAITLRQSSPLIS